MGLITKNPDVVVVVPAFNEESQILNTIKELEKFFDNIIVVDDGSNDSTQKLALSTKAIVIKHIFNLGQGAALQTGIEAALKIENLRYIITFDADGQHSSASALAMLDEIKKTNVDVILGSRFINNQKTKIPLKKRIVLKLALYFTRLDSGLATTDTHNGLRVFTSNFAKTFKLRQAGMAHASEILTIIKRSKATWKEFPVEVIYTPYSIKKGQSVLNAINIVTEMMHK